MTREECVTLTQYVGEVCPQQRIGTMTGLAWHDVIGHLDFAECRTAAAAIAARQPFVAPSEIITEIAAKRSVSEPHSNACRGGDCRECHVSWCNCTCHPAAVAALTAPQPGPRPAVERSRETGELRQLGPGDFGRSP